MTIDGMIKTLAALKESGTVGDTQVFIDCGWCLTEVEEVDLDASSLDVIIWCGKKIGL